MKLSILIPTIIERQEQFNKLVDYLHNLIDLDNFNGEVEILSLCDDKQMTIGEKRQALYDMANGEYSWQIDDDDEISPDGLREIMYAITDADPDCVTFQEKCLIDGVESFSNFSLKYDDWAENTDGWDHVRTPFFKTPIKTELCRKVSVPHVRFGEDHLWAQKIKYVLKSETHLEKFIYYYIHKSTPFNERYGIKE